MNLQPKTLTFVLRLLLMAVFVVILMVPTVALFVASAAAFIPFGFGFFAEIASISATGLLFAPCMRLANGWARELSRAIYRKHIQGLARVRRLNSVDLSAEAQADQRAQWSTLIGLVVLLTAYAVLVPHQAKAQMRTVETEQPSKVVANTSAELALARRLQNELRLNEADVVKLLHYLRQGYTEGDVRNIFSGTARK